MTLFSDTDILIFLSPSSREGFKEATQYGCWADCQNKLLIFPFQDELLTPVGYDLTIGDRYLSLSRKRKFTLVPGKPLVIQPNETVLIVTKEYIGLPKNKTIGGVIESKVSVVSFGLSHISTTLDNDWEGHLLIAITNHQSYPVTLQSGQSICTAMFFMSMSPATKTCGKPLGRRDITEERLDRWLEEAQQAKAASLRKLLPALITLGIILACSIGGLWLFGPTEGFSGSVAIGAAVAVILYPLTQSILPQ